MADSQPKVHTQTRVISDSTWPSRIYYQGLVRIAQCVSVRKGTYVCDLQEKYKAGPAVEEFAHPAAHNTAVEIAKSTASPLAQKPRQREGWLMKKGKDTGGPVLSAFPCDLLTGKNVLSGKWCPRWFELDFPTLKYWACEKKVRLTTVIRTSIKPDLLKIICFFRGTESRLTLELRKRQCA